MKKYTLYLIITAITALKLIRELQLIIQCATPKDTRKYSWTTPRIHLAKQIVTERFAVQLLQCFITMCKKPTKFAENMFRLVLLLFSILQTVKCSSILVKDGVYSRVTVQIQDQPQPSSCVAFLDHLEVRDYFFVFNM